MHLKVLTRNLQPIKTAYILIVARLKPSKLSATEASPLEELGCSEVVALEKPPAANPPFVANACPKVLIMTIISSIPSVQVSVESSQ